MASDQDNATVERQPFDETPLADPEERQVIFAVLDSLRQYRKHCHYNTTHRRRQNLYALPNKTWRMLAADPINMLDTFSAVDDAIDHNADVADAILNLGLTTFGLSNAPIKGSEQDWHGAAKSSDLAKTHSTIRQFYRDWSADGFKNEVKPFLDLILSVLRREDLIPTRQEMPAVLLPGAGLGRLLFELALAGYNVEGNEISYHQLLGSNFILNTTGHAGEYGIYPFATSFTNHLDRSHQLMKALIPDIHPGQEWSKRTQEAAAGGTVLGNMNMTAGDFLTSYSSEDNAETFDVVLTVYFIDTAPNFLRYVEVINHCLKPGALWINIGPLLWHFDDRWTGPGSSQMTQAKRNVQVPEDDGIGEPGSFELTEQEVLLIVEQSGFNIITHEVLPDHFGGYIQNPNSMLQSLYRCSHWVARKKAVKP